MNLMLFALWYYLERVVSLIFEDDLDVMSLEVHDILSHKEDAEKYKIACAAEKPVTIVLHTGRSITLI